MSMSNALETALIKLLFENDVPVGGAMEDIGSGTAIAKSSVNDSFYVSLHTADPGEAGTQQTSEASYTGYANRQPIARDTVGFRFTSPNIVDNKLVLTFDTNTGASQTITHWGLGTDDFGAAGNLLFSGPLGIEDSQVVSLDTTGTSHLFQCADHGYVATDEVVFITTIGDALPTGITEGTVYYVMSTGLTTNDFGVESAVGAGPDINASTTGKGRVQQVSSKAIATSDSLSFAANQLIIKLD